MDFTFLLISLSVGFLLGSYFIAWHFENIGEARYEKLFSKFNEYTVLTKSLMREMGNTIKTLEGCIEKMKKNEEPEKNLSSNIIIEEMGNQEEIVVIPKKSSRKKNKTIDDDL